MQKKVCKCLYYVKKLSIAKTVRFYLTLKHTGNEIFRIY